MRPQLREMLNNLGGRIREFDDAYAEKVRNLVMAPQGDSSPMGVARSMAGAMMGSPITYGPAKVVTNGVERMPETIQEKLIGYGIPTIGATARYVVPGAGLTAAGMGLAELTGQFYDQASNTPVLPM